MRQCHGKLLHIPDRIGPSVLEDRIATTNEASLQRIFEDGARLKRLDELYVAGPSLRARVRSVLLQNLFDRYPLNLPQAGDDATGAMATLVAMDPERMIRAVQDKEQSLAY